MKRLLTLVLAALMLLSVAACSKPQQTGGTEPAAQAEAAPPQEPVAEGDKNREATITLWHDKGDSGIAMFDKIFEIVKREYPNATLEQTSYSSPDFISKSIVAINSGTAPTILFNDYFRIVPIEQQTSGLMDLTDYITAEDYEITNEIAMKMGQYDGKQIVYPNETTYLCLGIRKSWLDAVGGEIPKTLEDFRELAYKFTYEDPDGNGVDDTYGFAAAFNAPGAHEYLEYFTCSAGFNDVTTDAAGKPTFNEANRTAVLKTLVEMYNVDKSIPTDSINHTYSEMYQYVLGEKVGMFRTGDWNLVTWDDLFGDDLILCTFPVLNEGDTPNAYFYSMRGVAIPDQGENRDIAIAFAKACTTLEGQKIHYEYFRGTTRYDFEVDAPTDNELFFLKTLQDPSQYNTIYTDTHSAILPFVTEIEEVYQRAIQELLMNTSADWAAVLNAAEAEAAAIFEKN